MLRIGYGEDAHALTAGRPLVIGGVEIESERGSVAVSDGDVLLHALADALLSAWALGGIGKLFPPDDPGSRQLDSSVIVRRVVELLARRQEGGWDIGNVGAVGHLDYAKLGSVRDA